MKNPFEKPSAGSPERRENYPTIEVVIDAHLGNGVYRVREWNSKKVSTIRIEGDDGNTPLIAPPDGAEAGGQILIFRPEGITYSSEAGGYIRAGTFEERTGIRESLTTVERHQYAYERTPVYVAGIVVQSANEDAETFVRIDRRGYERDLLSTGYIPERLHANLPVGTIVVFKRNSTGEIENEWVQHKILGTIGDSRAEVIALAYRSNTSPEFTEETEREIKQLQERYTREGDSAFMEREATTFRDPVDSNKEIRGRLVKERSEYVHGETRLDLRNRKDIDIYTIDPESAKDFDDAISFRRLPNGNVEIGVHIADVAHFARMGSALEKDARFRQFTRYLKQVTVPMFPEFLSNTLASLEPHKDRLAYSTFFTFNAEGELQEDPWFAQTIINSKKRFSYKAADRLLEKGKGRRHEEMMIIQKFTSRMREQRGLRGALSFEERPEAEITYDTEGKAVGVIEKTRGITSLMIEDLMLAANEAQGAYILKTFGEEGRILLRAHEPPLVSDVIRTLKTLLTIDSENPARPLFERAIHSYNQAMEAKDETVQDAHVARVFLNPNTRFLSEILQELAKFARESHNPKVANYLKRELSRMFGRAEYTTELEEHFSLAVQPYVHATSPIRRYPDIMIQYLMNEAQLRAFRKRNVTSISREYLGEVADRANDALNRARAAEQDALQIAFMDLLTRSFTENGAVVFSNENAKVIDANQKGAFVELRIPGTNFPFRMRIAWNDLGCVERNGRWFYPVTNPTTNEKEERPAVPFFRQNATRSRTLILAIYDLSQINRTNRTVRFVFKGHASVRSEE